MQALLLLLMPLLPLLLLLLLLMLLLQSCSAVLQAVLREGVRDVHHLRQARHQLPRGAQQGARQGVDADPPVLRGGLRTPMGSTHSGNASQVSSLTPG